MNPDERAAAVKRLTLLVAAVLISSCGGTGEPSSAASPAQGAPVSGGAVTIPIGADPTLNPWSPNAFVESLFINRVLFDGLTKPGKDLAPAQIADESQEGRIVQELAGDVVALPDFSGPRGRVVVPVAGDVLEGEFGIAHRRKRRSCQIGRRVSNRRRERGNPVDLSAP